MLDHSSDEEGGDSSGSDSDSSVEDKMAERVALTACRVLHFGAPKAPASSLL